MRYLIYFTILLGDILSKFRSNFVKLLKQAPGICYRLFTKDEYNRMEKDTEPEIKRCNLAPIILLLKALDIDDVLGFDYLDPPSRTLCT